MIFLHGNNLLIKLIHSNNPYMKTYFIFIVGMLSLSMIPCKAQKITVHLSIEWTKKLDKEDRKWQSQYKIDSIPLLTVSYQNNSMQDLYVLKAVDPTHYFPYIGIQWLVGEIVNLNYVESQEHSFSCIMQKDFEKKWRITGIRCWMDTFHKSNEKFEQWYNKSMGFKLGDFENSYMFFPNDLLISSIMKNKNKDFVFLKKKSTVKDYYSLLGFFLHGGEFKFYLQSNHFCKQIFARPQNLDTSQSRKMGKVSFDGVTILLPDNIDGYILYSDICKSDTVHVNFHSPTKR